MRPISLQFALLFAMACEPVTPGAELSDGSADVSASQDEQPGASAQSTVQGVMASAGLSSTASTAGVVAVTPYESKVSKDTIAPDTIIASWEGGQLTMGELRTELAVELSQLDAQFVSQQREAEISFLSTRYDMQTQTAEGLATQAMLEVEAAAGGYADVDSLVQEKVIAHVPEPTEQEVQELYAAARRQLQGASLDDVRPMIEDQIRQENARAIIDAYVTDLHTKYGLESHIPFPEMPRIPVQTDNDPFLGSQDGPVEIVVFAEYQCPYCATVTPTLEKLVESYPDQLHVVFRDFPLNFHDRAIPAAIAANCAGEQGKYWEMHYKLMANQRGLTDENFQIFSQELGLNSASFSQCLLDPAQAAEVDADYQAGMEAGVNGTPTVYVNGIKLTGGPSYDGLAQMIERELNP